MGSSQSSTRKITLVDDEKAGVIKLSESLAHRLRGQLEGQQAAAAVQKSSLADVQEPLHSVPTPPLSPPPSHAPLPSPPPSFIEKPLPIAPEAPKVPEVIPVPEASKVPKVTPIPVVAEPILEPPEPSSSSNSEGFPREVISEPLAPEPPPPSPGESLPALDIIDINPSLPETSLANQLISGETTQSTPDDISQISEPKEIVVTEVSEPVVPASAFLADLVLSTPAPAVEETAVAPIVVEETSVVADDPALEPVVEETSFAPVVVEETSVVPVVVEETSDAPVVEETSVVADVAAAVAGSILEVHLPPPETLLTAAFASDAIETTASSSVSTENEVTRTVAVPVPQLIEEMPADPSSETECPATPDYEVAIKAGPSPTLSQPAGNIPPWSIYAEEAHLMVMRLREEKDQEIKKLNQDWREKMDSRETEFVKMARLSEEQVASALKEVESLFMKASCSPVCQNQQEAVVTCYQDYPHQSLRCAREVEHFTKCVDLSRLQSIMKQEAH